MKLENLYSKVDQGDWNIGGELRIRYTAAVFFDIDDKEDLELFKSSKSFFEQMFAKRDHKERNRGTNAFKDNRHLSFRLDPRKSLSTLYWATSKQHLNELYPRHTSCNRTDYHRILKAIATRVRMVFVPPHVDKLVLIKQTPAGNWPLAGAAVLGCNFFRIQDV